MTIIYVPIRFSNADNWGHLKRVIRSYQNYQDYVPIIIFLP